MIDAFAYFHLPSVPYDQDFKTADLKALAARLQGALAGQGYDVGDLFGSDTDMWGFPVRFDGYFDVDVGIWSPKSSRDNRWSAQVHVQDPGWLKTTRDARLAKTKEVEWAVHDALRSHFDARNLEWYFRKGPARVGEGQPTP